MSDKTKAALEAALSAHIADQTDGDIVTDWALVAATSSIESIGTGRTAYFIEANTNQPVHVMAGLFRYASEHVIWYTDDEDDE
ncbi:hypothetical protein [Microcella sp.]|uniref:hypothetical protein n=1 Tax=Microcella sp. TaxID=1913979 RepID=UPI00391AA1CF